MMLAIETQETPRPMLATVRRRDPQRHERKLLLAIVEQALQDARESSRYGLSGPAIEAMRWLQDRSEAPFSFRWICRMLNVHPNAAQARLHCGRVYSGEFRNLPDSQLCTD